MTSTVRSPSSICSRSSAITVWGIARRSGRYCSASPDGLRRWWRGRGARAARRRLCRGPLRTAWPLHPAGWYVTARVDPVAIGAVLPRDVARRQKERERAALTLRALDPYLAAEEASD